ncbi:hypothetical protein FKM82_019913 [Ascaphus truei]
MLSRASSAMGCSLYRKVLSWLLMPERSSIPTRFKSFLKLLTCLSHCFMNCARMGVTFCLTIGYFSSRSFSNLFRTMSR